MTVTAFMPVIVEATKFIFGEVSKYIDQVRAYNKGDSEYSTQVTTYQDSSVLTRERFSQLESNPDNLLRTLNRQLAETSLYEVEKLVELIRIHRRNLIDLEATCAEFGPLTPLYVKRGIEHETSEITKNSMHLKKLLEAIYGKRIETT